MADSNIAVTHFSFFQLWRLVVLEPPGVQEHNIPHFKGLINADWKSLSSRAWRKYYYPLHPLEKGHFTPKTAKGVIFIFLNCSWILFWYLSPRFCAELLKIEIFWYSESIFLFKNQFNFSENDFLVRISNQENNFY